MKRVGLFGGSFDPVHNAHVALARLALEQLAARRGCAGSRSASRGRRRAASADARRSRGDGAPGDRRRAALRARPQSSCAAAAPSFTLDTVRELAAAEPGSEWFLILGQDQYASLHTWRDWRELLGVVTLAIANRPGASACRQRPDRQGAAPGGAACP